MDPETQGAEQPIADSVSEDRIASLFGGDDPAPVETNEAASEGELPEGDEPTEPTAPAEETFELEIDGEKFTLPKKLEKGFLQEKDYTQKAQTLADQRRNAELVLEQARVARLNEQFATETTQEQEQLRALDWALQQPVDWNSMTTDEAFRRKLQLDAWKDEKARIEKGLGEKRQQFGQKVQAEFAKLRQQSIEQIQKRIPGWNEATAKAVREHALASGLTEAEVNQIIDPRHVEILWKAQQYEALKAKATPTAIAAKTVKTTPTNPMPEKTKQFLNFRKVVQTEKPNSPKFKQALTDRIASKFGG